MSKSYRSINIFVSHPFEPNNTVYDIEKFRTNIKLLISQAENSVRKEYQEFDIETTFVFNDSFTGLPQQIERSIRNSHIAIVDLTESKPNIFFEYGLLYGLNIPVLLIKANQSKETFPVPADIKDRSPIMYETFDNLLSYVVEGLSNEFKKILKNNSLANVYLSKIWFPNNAGVINVIAPPEPEKSESASPDSKNYIFLNNLGDIDTVLEIMNFLNRNYRGVKVDIHSSEEFKNDIEDNLVVIGGPGDSEEDGNSICSLMIDKIDVKISYSFSDDDETMLYKEQKFSAVYRGNKVIKDYGYFARFPNPFNPNTFVILIHGIHTFGVLGAAKAFSDHPSAQGNIRKVMKKLNLDDIKDASFECFFPVDVLKQSVVCPEIDENYILPLMKKS